MYSWVLHKDFHFRATTNNYQSLLSTTIHYESLINHYESLLTTTNHDKQLLISINHYKKSSIFPQRQAIFGGSVHTVTPTEVGRAWWIVLWLFTNLRCSI